LPLASDAICDVDAKESHALKVYVVGPDTVTGVIIVTVHWLFDAGGIIISLSVSDKSTPPDVNRPTDMLLPAEATPRAVETMAQVPADGTVRDKTAADEAGAKLVTAILTVEAKDATAVVSV
jgi:hypothetical protein